MIDYSKKRLSVPTQQYNNLSWIEETFHDHATKNIQRKRSMISTDKYEVEVSFNLKTPKKDIMHTFFYSDISEFAGSLQGIINEGTYKATIQNMHKLGWKSKLFKSADLLMLDHGCSVSKYHPFYDRILKYIKCYHVHIKEAIQVISVNFFARTMDFCIIPIS